MGEAKYIYFTCLKRVAVDLNQFTVLDRKESREVNESTNSIMDQQQMLGQAEDIADKILRNGKHILPHLGRIDVFGRRTSDVDAVGRTTGLHGRHVELWLVHRHHVRRHQLDRTTGSVRLYHRSETSSHRLR